MMGSNHVTGAAETATARSGKSIPRIVEGRAASNATKPSEETIASSASRLKASWRAGWSQPNVRKSADGALCAIGLGMFGVALLAYFGVI